METGCAGWFSAVLLFTEDSANLLQAEKIQTEIKSKYIAVGFVKIFISYLERLN